MAHRNVIVLEGGGAKGPYEMGVLTVLEKKLQKPIKDFTSLVVSTSVGAIIGSLVCTGKKSAEAWSTMFLDKLPYVFKKRGWFFPLPVYDATHYKDCYEEYVGKNFLMRDLAVWLMCTSVDRCEPRPHFFKSWEKEDGALYVADTVMLSFSAPYFFGATIDEKNRKIWLDGGMSYNNLPLMKAYIEILLQGWLKNGDTVHILAVGSGRPDTSVSFDKAKKRGIIGQTVDQIKKYLDITDGGLTREMASLEQVRNMKAIMKSTPNLTCQWIDWADMPKQLDKMDDVRDRFVYYAKGIEDGNAIDKGLFKC